MADTTKLYQIIQVLGRTSLFDGVDDAALEKIAKTIRVTEYGEGTEIITQGDHGDAMYILLRGKCAVLVGDPDLGMQHQVAELSKFDSFGEMALLLDEKRSATVQCRSDVTCLVIKRDMFDAIVNRLAKVGLAISRNLARRLHATDKMVGFQFVRLADYRFEPALYQSLPTYIWERNQAIPLKQDAEGVTVAMVRPNDPGSFESISQSMPGMRLKAVAVTESDYRNYVEHVIHPALGLDAASQASTSSARAKYRPSQVQFYEIETVARQESGGPSGDQIIGTQNEILANALNRGASDIHVEPSPSGVKVRLRVDGRLITYREPFPINLHAPLVSRNKLTGGMDIAEKRKPQDGRAAFSVGKERYDIRISTMPTKFGEKVVMRVLDPKSVLKSLDELICSKTVASMVRNVLFRTSGCVFVCGPTGSGKTTTIYASLNELVSTSSSLNICTVEDPIEYSLDGVVQTQVSPQEGCRFADILRALLRQDPDVMMVGEMRDAETASMAMEGALTGHMVMSTLHAEGAVEATTRLIDMGCPPFLVSNALDLVVAQRLLRRICPECAEPFDYSDVVQDNLQRAGIPIRSEAVQLKRGSGCSSCSKSGYYGRVGAYEVVRLTDAMRDAIVQGEGEGPLKKLALEERAMATFRQYAGYLLRTGLTTPSEVLRFFGGSQR